jgi:hypothetical protein
VYLIYIHILTASSYAKRSFKKGGFSETMAEERRKIYGSDSGYKLWFTRIIGNLSKSRLSLMLKRGILTEIPPIEGGDLYPLLPEVGKEFLKDRRGSDTV